LGTGSENIVFGQRASAVLYRHLCAQARPGTWLLPANVCPIVPAVFNRAGAAFQFVDIESRSLCMDSGCALALLSETPQRYAGLLFVRSYGHAGDFSAFFRDVKRIDSGFNLIDDRCLCQPGFTLSAQGADFELYSTGYAKFVELGWGGWGILRNQTLPPTVPLPYEAESHAELVELFRRVLRDHAPFLCPQTPWLDTETPGTSWEGFRSIVESRIKDFARHRQRLNSIYSQELAEWAAPAECQNWRFTFFCDLQQPLLRAIFASGHFASAHFCSLVPMFGPGIVPVADTAGKRVVNLFNDFRYSEERAHQLAKIVRYVLKETPSPSYPDADQLEV
jgi:hypothetical protein